MNSMSFKKKWENYWYHYKWHTIAGVFALILLVLFVKDFTTKEQYDGTVMVATSYFVDDDRNAVLKETLERYFSDIDGNGEVNLAIVPIFLEGGQQGEPTDVQLASAMQMKMVAEISTNPSMIYIFDDGFTNLFIEQGLLRDLSQDFPDNPLVRDKTWDISQSEIAQKTFIGEYQSHLGSKYYVSISTGEQVSEKNIAQYEKMVEGLYNMVNNIKVN